MWRFAAARAIGTSHIKANLPCQDRYACVASTHGTLVAAVSDGAGSASNAEQGAEIAVTTVMTYLRHSLEEQRLDFCAQLREAATLAREAIAVEANQEEAELRSYASTLLAVVICPDGGAALQIGDGVIVVSEGEDEWSWVFWPQRGEYANTTFFLTDEAALDRVEVEVLPRIITDIALMSDGLEPLAIHYASKTVHNPFFGGMFHSLHSNQGSAEIASISDSLKAFLSSDRVRSRTDDDTSVILATRRNYEAVE